MDVDERGVQSVMEEARFLVNAMPLSINHLHTDFTHHSREYDR